jgi:uncharacterized protein (TIGR03437 family)
MDSILRRFWLAAIAAAAVGEAQNAGLVCEVTAQPAIVRSEGVTERVGDVVLRCTGGVPNAVARGNLAVLLSAPVTNRIVGTGVTTDVVLTVDSGGGPAPANVNGVFLTASGITFDGLEVPLSPAGAAEVRIANLRVQASLLNGAVIYANIANTGLNQIAIVNSRVAVALPQPSLLASVSGRLICTPAGLPLPPESPQPSFADFVRVRAAVATTRITEAFAHSFATLADFASLRADTGTRFRLRLTGVPAAARIFVPMAIAGYDALEPTSAGDLGLPASGGKYQAGTNALLLSLVTEADEAGAGGRREFDAGPLAGTVELDALREVYPVNGALTVTYEVVEGNPFARQSAQIPVFLGLAPNAVGDTVQINQIFQLGPLSEAGGGSRTAPIPRFVSTVPARDCEEFNDCGVYFPQLEVSTNALRFDVPANSPQPAQFVGVRNRGGGRMYWTATLTYTQGFGFLQYGPQSWVDNGSVQVNVLTNVLGPGTYTAQLRIDAGALAGVAVIPITVRITPPAPAPPVITSVRNAAATAEGPLVAGSLARLEGTAIGGQVVELTVGGVRAEVARVNPRFIDFVVPPELSDRSAAALVLRVDGLASQPYNVTLAPFAPAIFPGGILNQDFSPNRDITPAETGAYLLIFASGAPATAIITVQIHDREGLVPVFAGQAPGLAGVQQINVAIPADLPAMQTYAYLCAAPLTQPDRRTCSGAEVIFLRRP